MALFEAKDLRKEFPQPGGAVAALQGVSLAIEEGEFVALTGDSGSGKTTLLSLLGALLAPTSGSLRFRGEALETASSDRLAELRRTRFGFVFQDFQLIRHLSVLDNIVIAHDLCGRRVPRVDAAWLLESLNLGHRLGHRPDALSRGEMQRVALARALIAKPSVIFADEPTANLDKANSEIVLNILRTFNQKEGLTVVMATHHLDLASSASREIRLSFGRQERSP
jgi:putative ABC transport system ATP-binding protein